MAALESQQLERVRTEVFSSADEACEVSAQEIAAVIRSKKDGPVVLGLATGSTPVRLYQRLIQMHREEGLSFANVVTFNLDEYYGLSADHPESYRRFMQRQLFDHVDMRPEFIHVPDGMTPRQEVFEACARYEASIEQFGGIDIQILGIGRTGHIGFNEPGSDCESKTRLVTLDARTRRDAARDFLGEENVPRHAITMGIGTILRARRIILLAWGASKSAIIRRAVEDSPTDQIPASFLQYHHNTVFRLDEAAASRLTRFSHPWIVGPVEWTPAMAKRSVLWLAEKVQKPILKLVDADYTEHGMADLLTERGARAYDINIEVFNAMQRTITGWPGGKPNADDSHRPERAAPHPKRVMVLAPEPQDDVLCLGGTLNRLIRQGHDVRVVYLTSGNLAVPDEEVTRAIELISELAAGNSPTDNAALELARALRREIEERQQFADDSERLRRFKGMIRRGEARVACRTCGVDSIQLHFLELPFYERGRYRQFKPTAEDVARLGDVLDQFRPHQIFATGSRSDPSSVDAVCFSVLKKSLARPSAAEWLRDCYFWIFRGGGEAWPIEEIDMAVPLSPDELMLKTQASYQHRTQHGQTPISAAHNEVWQQAEFNDRQTARRYDALGLAEYEAIETFTRWTA
jgi:glucosamine-6-phosphate deaminase